MCRDASGGGRAWSGEGMPRRTGWDYSLQATLWAEMP